MRVLTGLQPSGKLHLGNYFASIKQMVDMQEQNEMFMFIANYHAMTSLSDGKALKQNTFDAACAFLALGIDPNKSIFWVQSDVKDVLELYWVLSQHTPMGLLERAHSYKDKVAKGISSHHGLFSYPVLMAADILLYNAQVVPVGKDQIQHVEIARDIAIKFNNEHGEIFTLPEAKIDENVATVPGTNGEKMSKSYGNTIDIFADAKTLKKQISSIVTDGTPLEEPKQWQNCNVYNIAKLFLDESGQRDLQARYERGGEGHGHFKAYLNELVWDYFKDAREKFEHYQNNPDEVAKILDLGAKKAQNVAHTTIKKVREAVGIYK
ncbi:tryptophan--tRNA ligase [Campylobacter concisus]|uniref:tryptophan--tRNA ligase n=1 Tax=Campylobacter concisus TaxID=199 RepID=UPI003D2195C6